MDDLRFWRTNARICRATIWLAYILLPVMVLGAWAMFTGVGLVLGLAYCAICAPLLHYKTIVPSHRLRASALAQIKELEKS